MGSDLATLLRTIRLDAGLSQLELSLRLEVSQRHVNFVERARARPSRRLLLAWLRETGCPTSIGNVALLQAGYAPLPAATPVHGEDVLLQLIALHQPNPGIVFDADWYIVKANAAARWLCEILMPGLWQGERLDMLATLADPCGWLARSRQPTRIAAALIGQLRAEQWLRPGLRTRVDALEEAMVKRYGELPSTSVRDPAATSFEVTLDTALGTLTFCAVQTLPATPHNTAGHHLRAELWFPANAFTSLVVRRHADATIEAAPPLAMAMAAGR